MRHNLAIQHEYDDCAPQLLRVSRSPSLRLVYSACDDRQSVADAKPHNLLYGSLAALGLLVFVILAYHYTNAPNFVGKTPAQFGAQYAVSYDAVSNWTQQTAKPANTTTAYTANTLNQYTQAGTAELKYDKNGNLTQDETFTYSYDWRNLINEVRTTADNAVVAQYRYDALGRRVAKVDGLSGDVTRYVLDGWNVVEERDDSGAVAASFVYDERGLPVAMQRSGKLYFYQYNHLGSIESVTNSDGDVVEQYRYDPFGGVTVADGAGNALPSSQIDNPFFFAGQWRDSETGLYYMRHRYYSASLGRFTSRDPLEYVDGLNAYAYAMSNPVNFSDPLGLSTSAGVLNTGAGNPNNPLNNAFVSWVDRGMNINPTVTWGGTAAEPTLTIDGRNSSSGVLHTISAFVASPLADMARGFDQTAYGNLLGRSNYLQGAFMKDLGTRSLSSGVMGIVGEVSMVHELSGISGGISRMSSRPQTAFESILQKVDSLDFRTPRNSAVFYSGPGQWAKASAFAEQTGGMTIEMTAGGKALMSDPIFKALSPAEQYQVWQKASAPFAEGALGHINGFINGARSEGTFRTIEEVILEQNINVHRTTYHY